MIKTLFGAGSSPAMLREGLNGSVVTLRETAHRVANATNGLGPGGTEDADPFAEALDEAAAVGDGPEVDLETEMVELANEQIRYDTGATLLQRVYAQLRSATRSS